MVSIRFGRLYTAALLGTLGALAIGCAAPPATEEARSTTSDIRAAGPSANAGVKKKPATAKRKPRPQAAKKKRRVVTPDGVFFVDEDGVVYDANGRIVDDSVLDDDLPDVVDSSTDPDDAYDTSTTTVYASDGDDDARSDDGAAASVSEGVDRGGYDAPLDGAAAGAGVGVGSDSSGIDI